MKDTVMKLKEEEVEVISSDDLIHRRSTRFTENAFDDPKAMVYEKSNAFALSYYGISKTEQSLLLAGLVAAYNVNKAAPYTEEEKKALTKRLNIIEGQIRGIKQMLEDDRYCADILIQLSAISKSLESVENSILESHIKSCVLTEIQSGNTEIIDEVMELFRRLR